MVVKLKRGSLILFLCLIIVIFLSGVAIYHYNNLININSEQDILSVIKEKSANADDDISYEIILKEEYAALFYQTKNNDNWILILEKDPIFSSKYAFFGYTFTSDAHNVYKYSETGNGKIQYLYAVSFASLEEYNNNSIDLTITQSNRNTGETKLITSKTITSAPYYDLFVENFDDDVACYFQCSLHDENGESIF